MTLMPSAGETNRNWGNVKENGWRRGMAPDDWPTKITDPWKGTVGMDDQGHAIFSDLEGVRAEILSTRAQMRTLFKAWEKFQDVSFCNKEDIANGDNRHLPAGFTLLRYCRRYAPTKDPGALNNPNEYADYLTERLATGLEQLLLCFDRWGVVKWPIFVEDLTFHMDVFENGSMFRPEREVILKGISFYHRDFTRLAAGG